MRHSIQTCPFIWRNVRVIHTRQSLRKWEYNEGPARTGTRRRPARHTDGIMWFLSKLSAEAREAPESELLW